MIEKDIFIAIGALSEMCGIYMTQLLKQGFTRKEAIILCQKYMEILVNQKNLGGNENG